MTPAPPTPDSSPAHEVDAVLDGLGALRFKHLIFTTNGYDLEPHLPALQRSAVTDVVFSVDTLDHARVDACCGVGPGPKVKAP